MPAMPPEGGARMVVSLPHYRPRRLPRVEAGAGAAVRALPNPALPDPNTAYTRACPASAKVKRHTSKEGLA